MSPTSKAFSLLGVAAAAFCLTSSAFAQDQPAPPPADGMAHHGMHHDGADHAAWRKAREEHRARFLHDVLNIRSDQEPAFQAFLADMQPSAHDHQGWAEHKGGPDAAGAAPLTTPERLDRMAAFMAKHTAERQAAFQHRAEAIKRFYAVLSPEQKRAFDALHDRGGMGHGHHGMGRHEGGPGEDTQGGHEHGDDA